MREEKERGSGKWRERGEQARAAIRADECRNQQRGGKPGDEECPACGRQRKGRLAHHGTQKQGGNRPDAGEPEQECPWRRVSPGGAAVDQRQDDHGEQRPGGEHVGEEESGLGTGGAHAGSGMTTRTKETGERNLADRSGGEADRATYRWNGRAGLTVARQATQARKMSANAAAEKRKLPVAKLAVVAVVLVGGAAALLLGVDVRGTIEQGMDVIRHAGPVTFFTARAAGHLDLI